MKNYIRLLFFLSMSFVAIESNSQANNDAQGICDTLSSQAFNEKVEKFFCYMGSGKSFTIDELRTLVRIYNTLHLAEQDDGNKLKDDFVKAFKINYRDIVINKFECVLAKGLVAYSRKYDIYVGGGVKFRCNDMYIVK